MQFMTSNGVWGRPRGGKCYRSPCVSPPPPQRLKRRRKREPTNGWHWNSEYGMRMRPARETLNSRWHWNSEYKRKMRYVRY